MKITEQELNIIRDAIYQGKKQHGMLEEVDRGVLLEQSDSDEFDFNKEFDFIQLKPKQWGLKGTFEAKEIDEVVNSLSASPGGIQKFKECLINLNKHLGITTNEEGLPTGDELKEASNLNEITSAVLLHNLLYSIVRNQDSSVAGKMFEGLVARMVGGTSSNENDSIEDLYDDAENQVSLKLIDRSRTEIKGSTKNLAKYLKENSGKGITYLVCVKDKQTNPLSFKAFSFTINRQNFFNFMIGKAGVLTAEEVDTAIGKIMARQKVKEKSEKEEDDETSPKKPQTTSSQRYRGAFTKYAVEKLGIKLDSINDSMSEGEKSQINESNNEKVNFALRNHLNNLLSGVNKSIESEKENYILKKYFPSITDMEKISSELIKRDTKGKIRTIGAFVFPIEKYEKFAKELKAFSGIEDIDKAIAFENDDNNINIINKRSTNEESRRAYLALLDQRWNFYQKRYLELFNKLKNIYNFFGDIEKFARQPEVAQSKVDTEAGYQLKPDIALGKKIEDFFDNLDINTFQVDPEKEKTKGETQFYMSVNQARTIAMSTNSNYDENYEQVVVDSGFLFANAQNNVTLLKQWVGAIYKPLYNLRRSLKKYFIANEPSGMTEANVEAQNVKTEVDNYIKVSGGKKASEISQRRPTAKLEENKKKHLTKHWSETILEDLLK